MIIQKEDKVKNVPKKYKIFLDYMLKNICFEKRYLSKNVRKIKAYILRLS